MNFLGNDLMVTCKSCDREMDGKSDILRSSLLDARKRGWSITNFLNCKETKCRNHKDNMDETRGELGI